MLGYTKPLTYALTMTKQEDTYRYVCVGGCVNISIWKTVDAEYLIFWEIHILKICT